VVALLIAVNITLILWQVFISDQRRFARDQGKLAAMQAALLFAEQLEMDLREIALRVPTPFYPQQVFTLDNPIRFEDQNRRIAFLKFAAQEQDSTLAKVLQVTYAFDSSRNKMVRTAGTESSVFKSLSVDTIRFEGRAMSLNLAALNLTFAPRIFRPELPIYLVKFQITAFPEIANAPKPSDVPAEQKCTLVNSVPIVYRADRTSHPYWSFNGSELIGER
jgi:hypothetical protein